MNYNYSYIGMFKQLKYLIGLLKDKVPVKIITAPHSKGEPWFTYEGDKKLLYYHIYKLSTGQYLEVDYKRYSTEFMSETQTNAVIGMVKQCLGIYRNNYRI